MGDHTLFSLGRTRLLEDITQKYLSLSEKQIVFKFFNESHEIISKQKYKRWHIFCQSATEYKRQILSLF